MSPSILIKRMALVLAGGLLAGLLLAGCEQPEGGDAPPPPPSGPSTKEKDAGLTTGGESNTRPSPN